ncbi:hypothetical protein B4Q13_17680, partial [Lacticaseibacillus rhamnosus]
RHLQAEYYPRMLAGQSEDWIRVYLGNELGFSIDGRVVFPEWSDSAHVAVEDLEPNPSLPPGRFLPRTGRLPASAARLCPAASAVGQ